MSGPSGGRRRFDVLAWMSERRIVLYVPEIEAATSVRDAADADAAVRDLIAELTGLDVAGISCEIRIGRPGGGGGPVGPAPDR